MKFEIRKNGKLISQDDLREQAVEKLVGIFDDMSIDDLLELCNYYREENDEEIAREFNEDNINEALEDWSPWDILNLGNDISWSYDYFRPNRWGDDLEFTDDVTDGLDLEDVAEWILEEYIEGGYSRRYLDYDGRELLDAYEEASRKIEELSQYPMMIERVIKDYKNCEADQYDLIYTLEKILRQCDIVAKDLDDDEEDN